MKKLVMALTMILSLPAGTFAFDQGGLEGNYLNITQRGAFNTAAVVQDNDSYGPRVIDKADIHQCGLLNSIYVDQKATWHSNIYKAKQVGFGNSSWVYQR